MSSAASPPPWRSTLADDETTPEAAPIDGVGILRAQVERRSRAVPAPRNPKPPSRKVEGNEGASSRQAAPERGSDPGAGARSDLQGGKDVARDRDAGDSPRGSGAGAPGSDAARGGEGPAASASPGALSTERPPEKRRARQALAPSPKAATSNIDDRPQTQPNEPLANLQVRVRRSLDGRLADLIHALRSGGVRTSKVELVELLLWELPAEPSPELRRRLADFRQHAPREEPL